MGSRLKTTSVSKPPTVMKILYRISAIALALLSIPLLAHPSEEAGSLEQQGDDAFAAELFAEAQTLYQQASVNAATQKKERSLTLKMWTSWWKQKVKSSRGYKHTIGDTRKGETALTDLLAFYQEDTSKDVIYINTALLLVEIDVTLGHYKRGLTRLLETYKICEEQPSLHSPVEVLLSAQDWLHFHLIRSIGFNGPNSMASIEPLIYDSLLVVQDPIVRLRLRLFHEQLYDAKSNHNYNKPSHRTLEAELIYRDSKGTPWEFDALRLLVSRAYLDSQRPQYDVGKARHAYALYQEIQELAKDRSKTHLLKNLPYGLADLGKQIAYIRVSNVFHPESEKPLWVHSQNLKTLKVFLKRLDSRDSIEFELKSRARIPVDQDRSDWGEPIADINYEANNWLAKMEKQISLPDDLPEGSYQLTLLAEELPEKERVKMSFFQVGRNYVEARLIGSEIKATVLDAQSGNPAEGQSVTLHSYYQEDDQWEERKTLTNAHGVASWALDANQSKSYTIHVPILDLEEGKMRGPILQSFPNSGRNILFAQTDKPAYRPGETVKWKLTARHFKDGEYAIPKQKDITITIESNDDAVVFEKRVSLNTMGSVSGEFTLHEAADLGSYSLSCDLGHLANQRFFRVEEYRLPEFEVEIEVGEPRSGTAFGIGDDVPIAIKANYLSGEPVRNATVTVNVTPNRYTPLVPKDSDDPFVRKTMWLQNGYGNDVLIKASTIDLETNDDGIAHYSYHIPYFEGYKLRLNVNASVSSLTKRVQKAHASLFIPKVPGLVTTRLDAQAFEFGTVAAIDFASFDLNWKHTALRGRAYIERLQWQVIVTDEEGFNEYYTLSEFTKAKSNKPDRFKETNQTKRLTSVETQELDWSTDDKGIGRLEHKFSNPGRYRIVFRGTHGYYNHEYGGFEIWIHDETQSLIPDVTDAIELIPFAEAKIGEPLDVLVVSPIHDGRMKIDELNGYQNKETSFHLEGNATRISTPVSASSFPSIQLTASTLRNGKRWQKQLTLPAAISSRRLQTDVTFDRKKYKPRQSGKVFINVTDFNGEPIDAEIGLSLADESVYQLFGLPQSIDKTFNSTRHNNRSQALQSSAMPVRLKTIDGELQHAWRVNGVDPSSPEISQGYHESEEVFELSPFTVDADSRIGYRASNTLAGTRLARSFMEDSSPSGLSPGSFSQKIQPTLHHLSLDQDGVRILESLERKAGGKIIVRNDFRTSIEWHPALRSGDDGKLEVEFAFGDKLSKWRARAVAITQDAKTGEGFAFAQTSKDLLVRLQTPRFFTQGDQATLTALVSNSSGKRNNIDAAVRISGLDTDISKNENDYSIIGKENLKLKGSDEKAFTFDVEANQVGSAQIDAFIGGDGQQDAVQEILPVIEFGIEQTKTAYAKTRQGQAQVGIDLPSERKSGSASATLNLSSGPHSLILDALPYLIDYPYGCTEQTLSRFVPVLMAMDVLTTLGLDENEAAKLIRNNREESDRPIPDSIDQGSLLEIKKMARQGFERLKLLQNDSGTWGWWSGDKADPYMTAYVVWAMSMVENRGLDMDLDEAHIDLYEATSFLESFLRQRKYVNTDLAAWVAFAVAHSSEGIDDKAGFQTELDYLWNLRGTLTPHAEALLALALHEMRDNSRAEELLQNLIAEANHDDFQKSSLLSGNKQASPTNQTTYAYWGEPTPSWTNRHSAVETTAFVLIALMEIDPKNELIQEGLNYLESTLEAGRWSHTRATGYAVYALSHYLENYAEESPEGTFHAYLNNRKIGHVTFSEDQFLAYPRQIEVPDEDLLDGANVFEIRSTSGAEGNLSLRVDLSYFSKEDPIPQYGNKVFVQRALYRVSDEGKKRTKLEPGTSINAGDLIETVLRFEAKQAIDYLMLEDWKFAGLETQDTHSGWINASRPSNPEQDEPDAFTWSNGPSFYREIRDDRIVSFARHLPQGHWQIRYESRAETPGVYRAKPCIAEAMYAPQIRGNSSSGSLEID